MISGQDNIENEDDLKTPTVEELSFPGNPEAQQKAVSKRKKPFYKRIVITISIGRQLNEQKF